MSDFDYQMPEFVQAYGGPCDGLTLPAGPQMVAVPMGLGPKPDGWKLTAGGEPICQEMIEAWHVYELIGEGVADEYGDGWSYQWAYQYQGRLSKADVA